jgi:succinate-semialdehyde dehydrogenase/glutarate-semialdehyde dehydrogenase
MLKKTVLELGGSDPYIILADANLEKAAEICANARLLNTGQSCIAAKRFIVIESIAEKFILLLKQRMQAFTIGDPLSTTTQLGPLARVDLRNQLHNQVQKSIKQGARCILGGEIPEGVGAFYPATLLVDVKTNMPAYQEELFGPVAAVISAKDENEAMTIANDTVFGLGAAVFTSDLSKGEKIAASQLQAGNCFVNAQVASDPRLPFGGIKQSGYGRELSHYGIKEFVNIKTVYINNL